MIDSWGLRFGKAYADGLRSMAPLIAEISEEMAAELYRVWKADQDWQKAHPWRARWRRVRRWFR